MTLQEYLDATGISKSELARRVPCSYSLPGMIIKGVTKPSFDMAVRIERVTDGLVSRENWYPSSEKLIDIPVDLNKVFEIGVATSVSAAL